MGRVVRIESHEVDTQARRIVPLLFPSSWEHREMTGIDYGIDMLIEIFQEGCATGNYLALQIKGTAKVLEHEEKISFDVPIQTLLYSELFATPVLLVLCPVNNEKKIFYYLWLQEYIKVILDNKNPKWRNNKSTVTVHIPKNNIMPGDEGKLLFISAYPKRLYEWCQYARICHELKLPLNRFNELSNYIFEYELDEDSLNEYRKLINVQLKELIKFLEEFLDLKTIFGIKEWNYPHTVLENNILPSLDAAKQLLKVDLFNSRDLIIKLLNCSNISVMLSQYFDKNYSRALWEFEGSHDF